MTNSEIIEYIENELLPKLFVQEAGDTVTNKYSGQSCFLDPQPLALYEWIVGTEMGINSGMLSGAKAEEQQRKYYVVKQYFRLKWPKEYNILID